MTVNTTDYVFAAGPALDPRTGKPRRPRPASEVEQRYINALRTVFFDESGERQAWHDENNVPHLASPEAGAAIRKVLEDPAFQVNGEPPLVGIDVLDPKFSEAL